MAKHIHSASTGFYRVLFASAASLVAVGICLARGHVQITLGDSSTYASPLQHRCGLLMVACVVWAVLEWALYLRPRSTLT